MIRLCTLRRLAGALVALALTTGCSDPQSAAPRDADARSTDVRTVTTSALAPGARIPAPVGPPVLTLTGRIGNPNVGQALQLDMRALESLGLAEYAVEDKQALGRRVTFSGVLLDRLLAVAQAAPEATTLITKALNDYTVDIPIDDVRTLPVLLATRADGEVMPVDTYGPLRVVYPYGSHPLDPAVYDPRWIWQLASIDVR